MKVALIQTDIAWEDRATNLQAASALAARAADQGAELAVFPEMFSYGFSMNAQAVAEPVDGPSTAFLTDTAVRLGLWLTGSVPVQLADDRMPRNRMLLAGPKGELHHYDKRHPFRFANEHEHYASGDPQPTFKLGDIRVTPSICYDLRFADDYWRKAPETDLYLVIANWPEKRTDHWSALLKARAIENQAYVAGVNRVGRGGELDYSGASALIDPLGRTVVESHHCATMLLGEVSSALVSSARAKFPALKDRR